MLLAACAHPRDLKRFRLPSPHLRRPPPPRPPSTRRSLHHALKNATYRLSSPRRHPSAPQPSPPRQTAPAQAPHLSKRCRAPARTVRRAAEGQAGRQGKGQGGAGACTSCPCAGWTLWAMDSRDVSIRRSDVWLARRVVEVTNGTEEASCGCLELRGASSRRVLLSRFLISCLALDEHRAPRILSSASMQSNRAPEASGVPASRADLV